MSIFDYLIFVYLTISKYWHCRISSPYTTLGKALVVLGELFDFFVICIGKQLIEMVVGLFKAWKIVNKQNQSFSVLGAHFKAIFKNNVSLYFWLQIEFVKLYIYKYTKWMKSKWRLKNMKANGHCPSRFFFFKYYVNIFFLFVLVYI